MEFFDIGLLLSAALFAGLVDSMAGGGGLIQIPTLLQVLGNQSYPVVFGTNKLSSIVGTSAAAVRYARRVDIPWNTLLPAVLAALPGAFLGAWALSYVPREWMSLTVPVLLSGVAWYTWRNKSFGLHSVQRVWSEGKTQVISGTLGFCIGFYDGIFGPGTGTFLMLGFVALLGFDFLMATACAKFVNVACNFAALLRFGLDGHLIVGLGLGMAAFNLLGSHIGSSLALAHGAALVRRVLLALVVVLICKTGWDAYSPFVHHINPLLLR
jgi:uncharacterized membrane protein YfcA